MRWVLLWLVLGGSVSAATYTVVLHNDTGGTANGSVYLAWDSDPSNKRPQGGPYSLNPGYVGSVSYGFAYPGTLYWSTTGSGVYVAGPHVGAAGESKDLYVSGNAPAPEYISKGCVTNWSPNPKKFILSYSDGTSEESPILYANQPVNWWCSQGKTNANPFQTTINEIVYNSDLGTNWNNLYGPYWAGTNTVTTGGTGYVGGAPGTGGAGTGAGSTNPVTGDQIATVNTNQTAVMYQGFQSLLGGLRTLGQQLGSNSAPDYSGVLGQIRTNTGNTAGGIGSLTNFLAGTNGSWDSNGFGSAVGGGATGWGRGTNLAGWGLSSPTVGSNAPVFTVPLSSLLIEGEPVLADATLDFGRPEWVAYIPAIRAFLLVVVSFGFVLMSLRIVGKVGGV